MKKLSTIFYLKNEKKNKEGQSAIYCKISVDFKTTTLSTGKYIDPARWEKTNRLMDRVNSQEKIIRDYLKSLENSIAQVHIDLIKTRPDDLSPLLIKNCLIGKTEVAEGNKTFSDIADYYIEYFGKKVKKGSRSKETLEKYVRVKNFFLDFLKLRYKKNDIELSSLTSNILNQFDAYLETEKVYKGLIGLGHNTTVKYMRNIRTMIRHVIKHEGWITEDPMRNYDKSIIPVKTVYLSEEEIERIKSKTFSTDRLERTKDIFLFNCYTGFAPVDLVKLRYDKIENDPNGMKTIQVYRKKTGVRAKVPLLREANTILDKYKNDPIRLEKDRILPFFSNCHMNEYLKEIATLCDIKKEITWYVARHTFATMTLNRGVSIESVSRMLGHTNIRQTQHYAKLLDKTVVKEMMQIDQ